MTTSPTENLAIRIVKGEPSPFELAALTVVLVAAKMAADPAVADRESIGPDSGWVTPPLLAPACSWAARSHPAWRALL